MNNIFELNFENQESKQFARKIKDAIEQKELYLKHIVIAELTKKFSCIDIDSSLFTSVNFYSISKLFDFYVNNN